MPNDISITSRAAEADPAVTVTAFERRARRIETPCGEGTLVWRAWGSGPPLVLTHGSGGAWSHWIRNIDALAAHRTVLALDLPGQGDSAVPPKEDHAVFADLIATGLREIVGADRPVEIAGFSLGGVVAAHFAAHYPKLVRRLVLIGTGGLDTPLGHVPIKRGVGKLQGEARREGHRTNLLAIMLHYPESVDELALYLNEKNGFKGRLTPMPLVLPDRLLEVLPKISAPLAVIWGELDRPHPNPAVQEEVFRRFHPNMEFRVIADSGHWAMYERADAFNRVLLDLLLR